MNAGEPAGPSGRAVLLMLASTLCFSGMHGAIRHVSADLHAYEIAFFRNLFGLLVFAPWLIRHGLAPLRTQRFPLHLLRAAINIVSMMCFFYALGIGPLTEISTLSFTSPIFAAVLAVFFFGERIGLSKAAAIALGFLGTLVVLRPGSEALGLGPILSLASAVIWAFALMVIKELSKTDSAVTIAAYMNILLAPLALGPAILVWRWPSAETYAWLVALAVMGTSGHIFLNQALKEAEASAIMPLDFVRIVWIALIAYFGFGENPDILTWVGGGLICLSAFWISRSGRPDGRRRAAHL